VLCFLNQFFAVIFYCPYLCYTAVSVGMYVSQSVCLSVCLYVSQSVCLSVCLSVGWMSYMRSSSNGRLTSMPMKKVLL